MAITPDWLAWLDDGLRRKCDPRELRDILIKNHFALDDIQAAMGSLYQPPADGVVPRVVTLTPEAYQALANVKLTRTAQRVPTDLAQIYLIDDFLTPAECEHVMGLSHGRLDPSGIPRQELEENKGFRTSSTCQLMFTDDAFVPQLGARTAAALGLNPSYSEGMQLQHYAVGQQYKAHYDFFVPHSDDYPIFAAGRGNRTWTFMIYLNDVPQGGGTRFHKLDLTFTPKKGRAIVWNSLTPEGKPNMYTLHSGEPVLEGTKMVVTEWFRELGVGDMIAG